MRALAATLLLACATTAPRPLPALPPPVDLATLLGPPPAPFIAPRHARRFPDTPIRAGQCKDAPGPGILVSPAVYAEQVAVEAEATALRREVSTRERLRVTERAAAEEMADACRERATELQAAADRAGRSGTWRAVVVLVVGVAVGFTAGWAAKPVIHR